MKQFQEWDTNGDGVLSREEIFAGYKNLYGEIFANEEVVCLILFKSKFNIFKIFRTKS
jgi:hypothetical protein